MQSKKYLKNSDEYFMNRAIELASMSDSSVFPNPKVGAVIVHNQQIIGEGYHQKYGEAHAEVNAVNSVKNKELLSESTIYVTLEPCSHHGKTPPCSDLLIHHRFKRVVIGSTDPFPLVNGSGIEKIRNSGIEVETGVLEEECNFLNRRFFTFHQNKRPYIILKWAETADGFLDYDRTDLHEREIHWITGQESQKLVHEWRSEEHAILVGWKTVLNDNPQLNVRHIEGKDPIRIILDPSLQAPKDSFVFDQSQPTLVYNKIISELRNNLQCIQLKSFKFADILNSLFENDIQSVIIEGGAKTLNYFIENNLWDEIRRFKSTVVFENGLKAPIINEKPYNTTYIGKEKDKLEVFYFRETNG